MKTITIRGIEPELENRLRETARANGDSLNATVLKLLRRVLNLDKRPVFPEHHDLDHLAGTWTAADEKEFRETQEQFERIDEELWR